MDSSDLAYFRAVAEEGSLTRAAVRLHCVQSNVTARIRALEHELKTPLFHRHGRGVALTRAGQALLPYAGRVLSLLSEAAAAIGDSPEPRGPLAIGTMETTAAVRLPAILAAFHAAYPEVELSITTGSTTALLAELRAYHLDGAFVAGPVEDADLVAETVFVEEMAFVGAKGVDWPIAHGDTRRPITFLAFRPGCSYRTRLEHIVREMGFASPKLLEFGTLEGILGGVAAGIGLTLLPRAVAEDSRLAGTLAVHMLPPRLARVETVFARRREALETAAMRAFLDAARGKRVKPLSLARPSPRTRPAPRPAARSAARAG